MLRYYQTDSGPRLMTQERAQTAGFHPVEPAAFVEWCERAAQPGLAAPMLGMPMPSDAPGLTWDDVQLSGIPLRARMHASLIVLLMILPAIIYVLLFHRRMPTGNPCGTKIVRWAFNRWFGTPWPKRIYLKLMRKQDSSGGSGCGCIVPLKVASDHLIHAVRAVATAYPTTHSRSTSQTTNDSERTPSCRPRATGHQSQTAISQTKQT